MLLLKIFTHSVNYIRVSSERCVQIDVTTCGVDHEECWSLIVTYYSIGHLVKWFLKESTIDSFICTTLIALLYIYFIHAQIGIIQLFDWLTESLV